MIETKSSKPVPKPRAGVRKSAVRVCGQERSAGLSWGFSWAPHPYTSPGWWGEPRRGPGACPAAGIAGLCLCQSCCGVEASPGSRRAGRGGNSPGGMGLKCPAGSSTACTCKPCRAAVRSIGELQYGIPHSQNQPRLELLRSKDCYISHCLPLMSPFVCVLLAPPAQVPLPPDTRCCYCHTCTTHRPSYLPLQSVSPGAKVFTLLPAIFPSEPTRAASPLPLSPAVPPCPASLLFLPLLVLAHAGGSDEPRGSAAPTRPR